MTSVAKLKIVREIRSAVLDEAENRHPQTGSGECVFCSPLTPRYLGRIRTHCSCHSSEISTGTFLPFSSCQKWTTPGLPLPLSASWKASHGGCLQQAAPEWHTEGLGDWGAEVSVLMPFPICLSLCIFFFSRSVSLSGSLSCPFSLRLGDFYHLPCLPGVMLWKRKEKMVSLCTWVGNGLAIVFVRLLHAVSLNQGWTQPICVSKPDTHPALN